MQYYISVHPEQDNGHIIQVWVTTNGNWPIGQLVTEHMLMFGPVVPAGKYLFFKQSRHEVGPKH